MALPGERFVYSQACRRDDPKARKAASLVSMGPVGERAIVTPANLSMVTILSTVGISSALWGLGWNPGIVGKKKTDRR